MTAAGLAGMRLISSSTPLVDDRLALLLKVSQPADGMTVNKSMIVSGDAKKTVMIVGTFPKEHEPQIGDAMKDSLLTARWAAAAAPADHFEGLSFRVSPTTSLKIAGRMSNMVMLTESGQMGPQGPTAALFVVGTSLAPIDLSDLKAFAAARASQTKQLRGLRVSEQRATAIGNEAAYELVAEGTDVATGRLVTVYIKSCCWTRKDTSSSCRAWWHPRALPPWCRSSDDGDMRPRCSGSRLRYPVSGSVSLACW